MDFPSKDLQSVIKAVEICGSFQGCKKCPYHHSDGTMDCSPADGNRLLMDCLIYLKKYRKTLLGVKQ